MMVQYSIFAFATIIAFSTVAVDNSSAQSNLGQQKKDVSENNYDCSDIEILYEKKIEITREENLALMDEAFFKALNKFDSCQVIQVNNSNDGASGSGGGGDSLGGQSKDSDTGSVSSSNMSGTETPGSNNNSESQASAAILPTNAAKNSSKSSVDLTEPGFIQVKEKNGKTPEDIPTADNDSILEAQIRLAAINEPDPVLKKKLWNEYRKYKGLLVRK